MKGRTGMKSLRGRRRWIAAAVVVVALAAAAIAYAAIPDANGVYTACKLNATGTIRLIDPSLASTSLLGHCTSLETQISWNQRGQTGAAGKDGLPGKDGVNGTNGIDGNDGAPGLPGKEGANGQDGVSVTSAVEAPGTNCPTGGSKFTAAGGNATFACNGARGNDGAPGTGGGRNYFTLLSASVGDISGSGASVGLRLTAPDGKYLAMATLGLSSSGLSGASTSGQANVVCGLYKNDVLVPGSSRGDAAGDGTATTDAEVTLLAVTDVTTADTVDVKCGVSGGFTATVHAGSLSLTEVQ